MEINFFSKNDGSYNIDEWLNGISGTAVGSTPVDRAPTLQELS